MLLSNVLVVLLLLSSHRLSVMLKIDSVPGVLLGTPLLLDRLRLFLILARRAVLVLRGVLPLLLFEHLRLLVRLVLLPRSMLFFIFLRLTFITAVLLGVAFKVLSSVRDELGFDLILDLNFLLFHGVLREEPICLHEQYVDLCSV